MNELREYRQSANDHKVCAEYSQRWDNCETKKQLFDLAMSTGAMFYFCESIADGWGLSVGYILDKFKSFVNGKYVSQQQGYTSEMYVAYNSDITIKSTNTVLIDCDCTVTIEDNTICNIIVVNSDVDITGNGCCYVHRYGNCNIKHSDNIKYHENGL